MAQTGTPIQKPEDAWEGTQGDRPPVPELKQESPSERPAWKSGQLQGQPGIYQEKTHKHKKQKEKKIERKKERIKKREISLTYMSEN